QPQPIPTTTDNPGSHLSAILDRVATDILRESPERCTSLGISEQQAGGRFIDRLSDASKTGARRSRLILEGALAQLRSVNRDALEPKDKITYDVVTTSFQNSVANAQFPIGGSAGAPYVVSQLTGAYRSTPDFLDAQHPLRNKDQADAYITRLG